ncbi:MAG: DUF1579 family protein [Phycisphaerae bacterium]
MKLRAWFRGAAFVAAAVLTGSQVLSQDKGAKGGEDEEARIKAMLEMAAPGTFHDYLKPLAGSWKCSVKYWSAPGTKPHESTATMEKKWILGGRFLTEEFKGTIFNDVPFAVFGIMGYDKTQKKYFAIHMDTTGTGFDTSFGTCDASCKVFTFPGDKESDPWSTLEIVNNDKNIAKGFGKGPDGKAWMFLEIVATRK